MITEWLSVSIECDKLGVGHYITHDLLIGPGWVWRVAGRQFFSSKHSPGVNFVCLSDIHGVP